MQLLWLLASDSPLSQACLYAAVVAGGHGETIPTARLLGMVFSSCSGGEGHWDSIDIKRASELLEKREHAGACVSKVGGRSGGRVGWVGALSRGRIERNFFG